VLTIGCQKQALFADENRFNHLLHRRRMGDGNKW